LKPGERLGVRVGSLTLVDDRAVPLEAQGLQRLQDLLGASGDAAVPVQILDPYPPAAAVMARIQEAAKRRYERAQVQ
jgi:hypothetical protein